MNNIEKIYSLLLHSNGLKIRAISEGLGLDKYYVSEVLHSPDNFPYWYQDDNSLWFAKEGALKLEERDSEIAEDLVSGPRKFSVEPFLRVNSSRSLKLFINELTSIKTYSSDEILELINKYRDGDMKAYDMLVKSHFRIVTNIAFYYCKKKALFEDLIQEGIIGLLKAIDRYNPEISPNFTVYAKSWIMQSIQFFLYNNQYTIVFPSNLINLHKKVHAFIEKFENTKGYFPSVNEIEIDELFGIKEIETAYKMPDSLDDLIVVEDDLDQFESASNIDSFYDDDYKKYFISVFLNRLSLRDKIIFEKFLTDQSLETIGNSLNLTRERTRQIVEQCIRVFRNYYNDWRSAAIKIEKPIIKTIKNNERIQSEIHKKRHVNIVSYQNKPISYIVEKYETKTINNTSSTHEIKRKSNIISTEVYIGSNIIYDNKVCKVINKYSIDGRKRLIIKYPNETLDDIDENKSKIKFLPNTEVLIPKIDRIKHKIKKEGTSFDYEYYFAFYINKINNIRQAFINGEIIRAKPALLVAIIDGISQSVIKNNKFILSEWLEWRYIMHMKKYTTKSQFSEVTGIEKPFWHLKTDGFWHLKLKSEAKKGITPSTKWLKDNVFYASLDDDLWILLQNKEWRKKLCEFIVEKKLK